MNREEIRKEMLAAGSEDEMYRILTGQ